MDRDHRGLAAALLAGAAALWWLHAPGVFTIDEPNHVAQLVAYQHGGFHLPGTDGLPPSTELAFFEPDFNAPPASPPKNDVPPLYGVIALPFAALGWDALFALNGLAYLAACALVFLFTRGVAERSSTAWLALSCLALGSYTLEYALGLWPHMLSMALCTGCFVLAQRAREGDLLWAAAAAGLLGGIAIGVRYPNVVYAGSVLLGLLLWAPRRTETVMSFGLAAAVPLTAVSLLNDARSGHANPISKAPGYLSAPRAESGGYDVADMLQTFWFRVVDHASRPSGDFVGYSLDPDPETGAFLWFDVVKKAWLQSSPWVAVALVAVTAAWWMRGPAEEQARRRTLQALGLTIWAVVAAFSVAGSQRPDGTCFNQRYLIDILPLAACALALAVERHALSPRLLLGGGGIGAAAVYLVLGSLERTWEHWLIMYLPLGLAALTLLAYLAAQRRPVVRPALALTLGACLAWSAGIHLATDLQAGRNRRLQVVELQAHLAGKVPPGAALFVWGQYRSLAIPLLLEQDIVIVDVARDQGKDAVHLSRALHERGRSVYALLLGFPPTLRAHMANQLGIAGMIRGGAPLLQLGNRGGPAPGARAAPQHPRSTGAAPTAGP